jgi:hypothetical protein
MSFGGTIYGSWKGETWTKVSNLQRDIFRKESPCNTILYGILTAYEQAFEINPVIYAKTSHMFTIANITIPIKWTGHPEDFLCFIHDLNKSARKCVSESFAHGKCLPMKTPFQNFRVLPCSVVANHALFPKASRPTVVCVSAEDITRVCEHEKKDEDPYEAQIKLVWHEGMMRHFLLPQLFQ